MGGMSISSRRASSPFLDLSTQCQKPLPVRRRRNAMHGRRRPSRACVPPSARQVVSARTGFVGRSIASLDGGFRPLSTRSRPCSRPNVAESRAEKAAHKASQPHPPPAAGACYSCPDPGSSASWR
jgi:hypothetical protein